MSILSNIFKPKSLQARGDQQAPALVIQDSQQRLIALGLTWRVMVAGGSVATAKRMAIAAKATHFCVIDGQTTGLATILGKSKKDQTLITPGASVACKRFGGDGVFAIAISDSEVWYFQMRNGLPTGSELIIQDEQEEGDTAAEIALRLCREAVAEFSGMSIYTDMDVDFGQLVTTEFSLKSLAELSWTSTSALIRVVDNDKSTVPLPLLIGGAIAICAYAGWSYYTDWVSAKLAEERNAALLKQGKEDDPLQAWKKALELATVTATEPNNEGIVLVRKSFKTNGLPAKIDGWNLKTINCNALPFTQTSQKWACKAEYAAEETVGTATNLQLKSRIPAAFTAVFLPVNRMSLTWEVASKVAALDLNALPDRPVHLVETASKLQTLAPSLTTAPNFAFEPVKIQPPLSVKKREPIPMPPGFKTPGIATIRIQGPVRSIDAVLAKNIPAQWTSILVTMGNKPPLLTANNATLLKQSAVTAELTGNLHAKQ